VERRIILVTHDARAHDESASRHLAARGFALHRVTPALGEALPEPDARTAGAIVFGGGQGVGETDKYPFLKDEMDWIGRILAADKPFLGLCQGAQLLAHHLGAAVGPHPEGLHEFGFYPLTPTAQGRPVIADGLRVMQFHHHGFDLPSGAVLLARSQSYPHQAFRVGETAFALQFHAEATAAAINHWHTLAPETFAAPGAHSLARQRADMARYAAPMTAWFTGFLDRLFVLQEARQDGVEAAAPGRAGAQAV